MGGQPDLAQLLSGLEPQLRPGGYVWTHVLDASAVPDQVHPVVTVIEDEALTLVCLRSEADAAGLAYDYAAAWITLEAHPPLDAAGLTATVAAALAGAGIACHVVAGLRYDHLFVPEEAGERALAVLRALGRPGSAPR